VTARRPASGRAAAGGTARGAAAKGATGAAAKGAAGGAAARPLAELGQGARGRIVEVRLPPGRRLVPESPLRPGAEVYVAEAPGGRWLHARIDYREFSVPVDVAEHVLVELPAGEAAEAAPARPPATDAYVVLLSRLDRRSWRVRIVDREGGAVARSEWFEDGEDARRRWEALAGDAARLDAAGFRARYRLP
jgi:FeoA domain